MAIATSMRREPSCPLMRVAQEIRKHLGSKEVVEALNAAFEEAKKKQKRN